MRLQTPTARLVIAGQGYYLRIELPHDKAGVRTAADGETAAAAGGGEAKAQQEQEHVSALVTRHVPAAELLRTSLVEQVWTLPLEAAARFPALLHALDEEKV